MGHHQSVQQQKYSQLNIVKKYNNYSVLQNCDGKQFYKFVYISVTENQQKSESQQQTKSSSIFNNKYLQSRYNYQQSLRKNKSQLFLPQISAYGQQQASNSHRLITCSLHKLSYVIFQNPSKQLKTYIEQRIQSGQYFQQKQFLELIKITINGLIQLDQLQNQIYAKLNHLNINKNKNKFIINDENVYVKKKSNGFILSDLTVYLDQNVNMKELENNQKTVQKQRSKIINTPASLLQKNNRFQFFQKNLQSISLLIQSTIYKFKFLQFFGSSIKSSIHQGSISTALQTHRTNSYSNNINKNIPNYSYDFQNLIKLLQRYDNNEDYLLGLVNEMIHKIVQKKQKQKIQSQQISRQLSKQNSYQKNLKNVYSLDKITKITNVNLINTKNNQSTNALKQININSNIDINNRNSIIKDERKKDNSKNHNTKIRLSLRKDQNINNKQNVNIYKKPQSRKNSLHLNININKYNENICKVNYQVNKIIQNQNIDTLKTNQQKVNLRKRSQSLKIIDFKKNVQNIHIEQKAVSVQKQKKKVFLKKTNKKVHEQLFSNNKQNNINQPPGQQIQQIIKQHICQTYHHLNPISKKRPFMHKLNSNINPIHNFPLITKKTLKLNFNNSKKPQNNNINLGFLQNTTQQYIQNLSSIISNANNTLSSYGNPLTLTETQQFKTQTSQIQEEGCIQMNFQQNINEHMMNKNNFNHNNNNFNNNNNINNYPHNNNVQLTIGLSSLPSMQLYVQQIYQKQKQQNRIPDFLKQFKLPEKHLLALNNIILKQKDMIVQQSFQQSDLNSFRKSIPNLLTTNQKQHQQLKKRKSKIILEINKKISQKDIINCEIWERQKKNQYYQDLSMIQDDTVTHEFKNIQNSFDQITLF